LFFKALKQNLKVKTFVDSANRLEIQSGRADCHTADQYLQLRLPSAGHCRICALLRQQLFVYAICDLVERSLPATTDTDRVARTVDLAAR